MMKGTSETGPETKNPGLIRIFDRHESAQAYTLRDFLHRSDVPFEWIELTSDEQARALAGADNVYDPCLPVCVFPDGTRMEHPDIRQITEKLGWFRAPSRSEYDVAIYGAGPAGLSAAVYAASEGLRTVIVEPFAVGGQAGSSSNIENYLGFPAGITGVDLAERAREQAIRFGTEILLARRGVRAEIMPGKVIGHLDDGTTLAARACICATGVQYRRLGVANEARFLGRGLYYGAGASEAALTNGEHVVIVGGGNSAGQAALHFAPYAAHVTMVVRSDSLKSTLSQYLIDRILTTPNVEVLTHTEVSDLSGNQCLEGITLTGTESGTSRTLATRWLFVCIGGEPHTRWATEIGIVRDEGGYLVTGPDLFPGGKRPSEWCLERDPYYLETSIPGMFAAGDVRHGSVKRCASAVGEGAMAVMFVHRYLGEG